MLQEVLYRALFAIFSIMIAAADIRAGEVPRTAFYIAFPGFLAAAMTGKYFSPLESAAGLLAGLLVFLAAFFISGRKLGLADVWYSALIGMVLGPRRWWAAVGLACVGGLICLLVSGRRRIPFIPLLAFGSIVMIFIGWRQ